MFAASGEMRPRLDAVRKGNGARRRARFGLARPMPVILGDARPGEPECRARSSPDGLVTRFTQITGDTGLDPCYAKIVSDDEVRHQIIQLRAKAERARDLALTVGNRQAEANLLNYAAQLDADAVKLEAPLKAASGEAPAEPPPGAAGAAKPLPPNESDS